MLRVQNNSNSTLHLYSIHYTELVQYTLTAVVQYIYTTLVQYTLTAVVQYIYTTLAQYTPPM